eukprot:12496069-Alexandrium_andersonii.AAC.1
MGVSTCVLEATLQHHAPETCQHTCADTHVGVSTNALPLENALPTRSRRHMRKPSSLQRVPLPLV